MSETLLSFPVTPGGSKDDVSLSNKDVKDDQDSYLEKEWSGKTVLLF